jgi:HPt (histidine-containing phosphotransfer) domain-containing protein
MVKEERVEKLSLYCLDELVRMSAGDHEFIADILHTITETCPGVVQSIEGHFQTGDMKALAFTLHKFKSTVHIIGNKDLTALVSDLEIKAKNEAEKESLHEDIQNLISAVKVLADRLSVEKGNFN